MGEILAFVLYFTAMLSIGLLFWWKDRKSGAENESGYFLGGRKMGPYVTALSAQASDMSGWLLMGLPGSILAAGFGEVWVAIGLAIGTYLNWLFVAKRLRNFSQVAGDSITIPQYLNNRFKAKGKTLQVISAIIFFVCFTLYVASGYKAGAALFSTVLGLESEAVAMVIFAVIMLAYTFFGGFKAVCWTDFFQALLMLVAITFIPIFILSTEPLNFAGITAANSNYFNFLPSGKFDWASISTILSGLAWGLGYCGMPHILVRFMSIKSAKLIKPSRRVATVWVVITLAMAALIGVVGAAMTGLVEPGKEEMVFINMVRGTLPPFIAGIFLSAILAAAMSTADSQLLVASSAFTSDIYKPIIKKNASEKEVMWVGKIVVMVIGVLAYVLALFLPSSIMDLVGNAWAGFGAAFGPVIILSLYWKRFTYKGAIAGMIAGGATVIIWISVGLAGITGLYELFPGFIVGMVACIVGSYLDKSDRTEIEKLFDIAVKFDDIEEDVKSEEVVAE